MTTTLDYVVTTGDFIDEWMEREGIIGRAKGGSARREVLVAPI